MRSSWSAQQVTEFLAVISAYDDERPAARSGIERAAEALDAEVAALVRDGRVTAAIGFPAERVPERALLDAAEGRVTTLDVPGAGVCAALVAPLTEGSGALVVARTAKDPFTAEETALARGMARALDLTLRMLAALRKERALRERSQRQADENARLLDALGERQVLLEHLSRIQRAILRRDALADVLDTVVAGAAEMLGQEVVGLQLVDASDPGMMSLVASRGVERHVLEETRHLPVGVGAAGLAITQGQLVTIEDYPMSEHSFRPLVDSGISAAMAAPVRENGKVIGSLVVASTCPGATFAAGAQDVLLAFAEHASLAVTDAKNLQLALHRALHDELTRLPNRALFSERLEHALERTVRSRAGLAVLFLDLDAFKRVNDSLGHAAGDELLVAVADRLRAALRPGDTAARFGGDEFAILLEDYEDLQGPVAVAERLLAGLAHPFEILDASVYVSASIGIATERGSADDMIRNADLAMYRAKARGKGRYEVFVPVLRAEVVERLEVELDLRRALERGELQVHYQPTFDLVTEDVVGVEALVRWQHPRRGLIGPGAFLPVAEETGLIRPLGRWVLREAWETAARWREMRPGFMVGVNLSATQLEEPDLVDELAAIVAGDGDDHSAAGLVLEITETVFMHDAHATLELLARLKALGARLAIDDFGTGFSSLQYLRQFPLDILKIAKPFVDTIGGSKEDLSLARAIIDLGRSFRLDVIAEGIETPGQVEQLRSLGCRYGQGFHFARPAPAEEVDRLLAGAPALA